MTNFPEINRYNALIVVVDKFGKLSQLVPCRVGEGFGVPRYVIHDHDVSFTAAFWKALWGMLSMQTLFSSADHPQTDGHTERQNCTVE